MLAIKARRAVVLACGGFEANPEMQRQYWQEKPVLNAAYMGNTGDGILMAQAVGAALWHMWHYHGVYGFKHHDPAYPSVSGRSGCRTQFRERVRAPTSRCHGSSSIVAAAGT